MANKAPTRKLSTMRTVFGALAVIMVLNAFMHMATGNLILAIGQLVVGVWAAWYAISPPAYVRKNFIQ